MLYEGLDLHDFNGTNTHLVGYIELMISVGKGKDVWTVSSQFLIFPCSSVNNFILGRPFTSTLNGIASLVHRKLKYHSFHGNQSP